MVRCSIVLKANDEDTSPKRPQVVKALEGVVKVECQAPEELLDFTSMPHHAYNTGALLH